MPSAYDYGKRGFRAGHRITENPYTKEPQRSAWVRGWEDERAKRTQQSKSQLEEPGTGDTVEPAHQSASLTQKSEAPNGH
jgi:ribosome modulation factor